MDRRDFLKRSTFAVAAAQLLGCTGSDPSGSPQDRPNILFAIADDMSFPHMSAYGTDWVSTPGFDRVADDGLLFNRAYTPNAKCAPSRACILTGRNSWQLEQAANHWCYFPQKFQSYPEALTQHGYHVGYTGKGWAPGIAEDADGNPRRLTGPAYEDIEADPPAEEIVPVDYAANFEAFLSEKPANQPFCFWYGGHEPHRRYERGVGIEKGGKSLDDIDRVPPHWPDNETVRTDMLDYAYEVEYFDMHLQRMLSALERQGQLSNTIVVVTADNGMPFPRIKGQEYDYSNHLPLAIMWPDGIDDPGREVDEYVSFIDFAPTFLELAGVTRSETDMEPVEGTSLLDILQPDRTGSSGTKRDFVLIGKERHDVGRPEDRGYPIRGIVSDGYLYIHNFETNRWPAGPPQTGYLNTDGSPTKTVVLDSRVDADMPDDYWEWAFGKRPSEELYHVASDRACVDNLAGVEKHRERMKAMKERLFAELRAQNDPRMFGRGHVFDDYTYANESDRNFYERYMEGEDLNAGWVNPSDFEPDFPER